MAFMPSAKTKKYEEDYYAQLNKHPGEFSSEYTPKKEEALNTYLNRKPFEYNADTDRNYNIYKRNYETAGKKAMKDTVGQATTLTGGYGNSYAQMAGQQVYNDYMAELESQLPQFEAAAYDRYNQEGNKLLNYYEILRSAEGDDYSKHLDKKDEYNIELARLKGLWDESYNKDYTEYRDTVEDTKYREQFDYQKMLDDRDYIQKQAAIEAENKPTVSQYQKAADAYYEGGKNGLFEYLNASGIADGYIQDVMTYAIGEYKPAELKSIDDKTGKTTFDIDGNIVTFDKGFSPYSGAMHNDLMEDGEYNPDYALKTKPWIPNRVKVGKEYKTLSNSGEKIKSRGREYTVFNAEGGGQYVWVGELDKYLTLMEFINKYGED